MNQNPRSVLVLIVPFIFYLLSVWYCTIFDTEIPILVTIYESTSLQIRYLTGLNISLFSSRFTPTEDIERDIHELTEFM
jgi:hypothetical protein